MKADFYPETPIEKIKEVSESTPLSIVEDARERRRLLLKKPELQESISFLKEILSKKEIDIKAKKLAKIRGAMRILNNEILALEQLGDKSVCRYLRIMEGVGANYPYIFTLPLKDEELGAYLDFDVSNSDYQDECVFEHISPPLSALGINLIISHATTKPDFLLLLKERGLYERGESALIIDFIESVQDHPEFRKSAVALLYLFLDQRRFGMILGREQAMANNDPNTAKGLLKAVRELDREFFKKVYKKH